VNEIFYDAHGYVVKGELLIKSFVFDKNHKKWEHNGSVH